MKIFERKKNKIFEILSHDVIPIQNYILKGDREPEHEIQSVYLEKLSMKLKPKAFIKSMIHKTVSLSLCTNIPSSYENKTNFTAGRKQKSIRKMKDNQNQCDSSGSDNNEDMIIDKKENQSLESSEILLTLFNQGIDNKNAIELTKRQKEKFKLEDNNPFLFSFYTMHPFSMFYGTKYDKLITKNKELKLPAPNFISKEDWCKPFDTSFKSIFRGIEINNKSGLVIVDPVVKKKFSGLIKDIIIQIIKVPFGHHISLNVKIFEPKTILERYTSTFSYANMYLLQACDPNITPYERLKLVMSFQFGGLYVGCQQLKPFNPFLGETYQGELPNGAKLYVENVTHKPLVARFLMIYKKKYEISGFWDLAVKAQSFGSEMYINQKGPINVRFPELDECITYHIPCVKAVNATCENGRALLYFGNQVFVDKKNNLKAVIQFNFNKNKFHEVKGCTMKYDFSPDYKYTFEREWDYGMNLEIPQNGNYRRKSTKSQKFKKENYIVLENINGSWLEKLVIGGKVTWDVNEQIPEYIRPVKHSIPSDGRYREDLIWLYRSFYGAKNQEEEEIYRHISMEWKVMMEEFNRWERKNRSNYKEKMKLMK